MFAFVLSVLSVYLAVAGLALALVQRYVTKLSRRTVVFLLIAPLALTGKAVFSGRVYAPLDIPYEAMPLAAISSEVGVGAPQSPILGDVVFQEIPWRKAVREAVKNGRLPLWNRFILAGEPLLATQQPAILHPFTWVGMLLPLAHAWTLEMSLGVFLALLSAFLFFRDLELSPAACAFGAVGWAFCDYLVFWAGYPLSPAAAPFPLLLLGLRRLARDRDARAVALTTCALFLITAAGHSETLLHVVAAAGLWFLYCLAVDAGGARHARLQALALSLVAGALSLGLTAVVLLPHIEALPNTIEYFMRSGWYAHIHKSGTWAVSLRKLQQIAIPYAFGISGHGNSIPGEYGYSNAYAGSLLIPLAAVGLLSGRRVRWFFLGVAILGFTVWATIPGITDLVSALPLFDIAINERLVFLGCFGLAALAALGAEELFAGRRRAAFLTLLVVAIGALAASYPVLKTRLAALEMPNDYHRYVFLLQVAPLALAALLWLATRGRSAAKGVLFLCSLLLAQRAVETFSIYPAVPDRAFYPHLEVLDPIPRDAPWRMTAVGFTFVPNISALYEVEDVRGYEAMTFLPLYDTYPLWCIPQPIWFNRIDDPTRPFLSFLNVRYVLTPPGYAVPTGWKRLAETPGGSLLENPNVLPRAFVPRELNVERDPRTQLLYLADIADFAQRGVVAQIPGHADGSRFRNGDASVAIRTYEPQRIVFDVDAATPAVVGTSMTAWPGWQLRMDGAPAELFRFNHAFLGFSVPAGRHSLVLRYFPTSFRIGASISAATLVLIVAIGMYRRRYRTTVFPDAPGPAAV